MTTPHEQPKDWVDGLGEKIVDNLLYRVQFYEKDKQPLYDLAAMLIRTALPKQPMPDWNSLVGFEEWYAAYNGNKLDTMEEREYKGRAKAGWFAALSHQARQPAQHLGKEGDEKCGNVTVVPKLQESTNHGVTSLETVRPIQATEVTKVASTFIQTICAICEQPMDLHKSTACHNECCYQAKRNLNQPTPSEAVKGLVMALTPHDAVANASAIQSFITAHDQNIFSNAESLMAEVLEHRNRNKKIVKVLESRLIGKTPLDSYVTYPREAITTLVAELKATP